MEHRNKGRHLLGTSLDEEWDSIEQTALVSRLNPGAEKWIELISAFELPFNSFFHIGVAVMSGSTWNRELESFALELVRVVPNVDYPDVIPPTRRRARVFHHNEPVTYKMLRGISPMTPDRPCIEHLRIDDRVSIEVRGVHHIEPRRWREEIGVLLKGAWLITRDDSLLATAELRYEAQISAAIEKMASQGHDRPTPPRFSKTSFWQCWPIKMSRSNLYNLIPDHRWLEVEMQYYKRWEQLHNE